MRDNTYDNSASSQFSGHITSGVVGDMEQPLKDHLKEFRDRLFVTLIVLFVSICIAYPISGHVLQLMWGDLIPAGIEMSVYSPLEWIFVRLKLSLMLAIGVALPLFLYEMFRFAAKGLYPHEKRFIKTVASASFVFFVFGAIIAYFLFCPLVFRYVVFYSNDIALAQMSVQRTLSFVTTLVLGFGLVVQLPLLMLCATKMGVISYETLHRQRIVAYGTLLGFAMFISPDPTFVAQLICVALLVILFELGLILAKLY